MKHITRIGVILLLLALAINIAPALATDDDHTTWLAQYYADCCLVDPPTLEREETVNGLNLEWGFGSPDGSIPVDNFSARFNAEVTFEPGAYRFKFRADDVARLSIDQQAIFNTLNGGQTDEYVTRDIELNGFHKLQVDYQERTGLAYINIEWERISSIGAPPVGVPTATVRVATLNVRNAPSTVTGDIITKVNLGQTYRIVARNPEASWWLIDVNGTQGWVSAGLIWAMNAANVPVRDSGGNTVDRPAPGSPTGFNATPVTNLRLRAEPLVNDNIITVIPRGTVVAIVGRDATATWLKVNFDGTSGWVAYNFVTIDPPLRLDLVPVVG